VHTELALPPRKVSEMSGADLAGPRDSGLRLGALYLGAFAVRTGDNAEGTLHESAEIGFPQCANL
jgi:hypothetical protein